MDDMLNSMNSGKKDWQSILAKKNESSENIADLGNSTVQSDVSPNKAGGEHSDTYELLTANNEKLTDLPEFKELRKKIDPLKLNSLKQAVTKNVRKTVYNTLNIAAEGQPTDLLTSMKQTMDDLTLEKDQQMKKANDAIKLFNDTIEEAKKKHTRTVGRQWTALPQIKIPEDLENFVITSSSGLSFINRLIGDVKDNINNLNVGYAISEAREKANVRSAKGDETITDDLETLYFWMKNQKNYFFYKHLLAALQTAVVAVTRASVMDSIRLGLKQKMQRIAASRVAKEKSGKTKNPNLIVPSEEWLVLVGDGDELNLDLKKVAEDSLRDAGFEEDARALKELTQQLKASSLPVKQQEPLEGPVHESVKRGPGKIAPEKSEYVQVESTGNDKINIKKKNIENAWKKYSEKNKDVKNNEEPNGFTISMG